MAEKKRSLTDVAWLLWEIYSHADSAGNIFKNASQFFSAGARNNEAPNQPSAQAPGKYGRGGFGDERQHWSILLDLQKEDDVLRYWIGFLSTVYSGESWLRKQRAAALKEDLRVFLTQWDTPAVETGHKKTTTTTGPNNNRVVIEELEKRFGKQAERAKDFILLMVNIMKEKEEEVLTRVSAEYRQQYGIEPTITETERGMARMIGYQEVLIFFRATGVPCPPADTPFLDWVEGWWNSEQETPPEVAGAFDRAVAAHTEQQRVAGPWFVRWPRRSAQLAIRTLKKWRA